MSNSEPSVEAHLLNLARGETPASARGRILVEVRRELDARRRDRRITRLAVALLLIAVGANWVVSLREDVRMARWFPTPTQDLQVADGPLFADADHGASASQKLGQYMLASQRPLGWLFQNAAEREREAMQVAAWIEEIAGTDMRESRHGG